jgi:hypothetical protein
MSLPDAEKVDSARSAPLSSKSNVGASSTSSLKGNSSAAGSSRSLRRCPANEEPPQRDSPEQRRRYVKSMGLRSDLESWADESKEKDSKASLPARPKKKKSFLRRLLGVFKSDRQEQCVPLKKKSKRRLSHRNSLVPEEEKEETNLPPTRKMPKGSTHHRHSPVLQGVEEGDHLLLPRKAYRRHRRHRNIPDLKIENEKDQVTSIPAGGHEKDGVRVKRSHTKRQDRTHQEIVDAIAINRRQIWRRKHISGFGEQRAKPYEARVETLYTPRVMTLYRPITVIEGRSVWVKQRNSSRAR